MESVDSGPLRAEYHTAAGPATDPAMQRAIDGSTVIRLQGHLFDTGLVKQALDVVEEAGGRFDLLEVHVRPNRTTGSPSAVRSERHKSSALMQVRS